MNLDIDVCRFQDARPPIGVCQYVAVPKTPPAAPPCCAPLSAEPLPRPAAARLAASFKALSEPARLRLLSLIQAQPDAEACVCNLIDPLGLSQPTVTHHLQVLHRAGLLHREKRGVWVYYRVERSALERLRRALS
jgi:ArsR family transcriptional regulator